MECWQRDNLAAFGYRYAEIIPFELTGVEAKPLAFNLLIKKRPKI
jgi:hypothetical protein